MRRVLVVIFLVHVRGSFGQFYAQGVGKSTYSCSDAKSNLEWLLKFLPSAQDPYPECEDHTYCTCGVLGRVVLDAPGSPIDSRHVRPPTSSKNGPGVGKRSPRLDAPNSGDGWTGDSSSASPGSVGAHYDASSGVPGLAARNKISAAGLVSSGTSGGSLRGLRATTSPTSVSHEAISDVNHLTNKGTGGSNGGRGNGNNGAQGVGLWHPIDRPGQGTRPGGPGLGQSSMIQGTGQGAYAGSGSQPAPHSPPPPKEKIARGFGVHTVEITEGSREHGALSVSDVEACVSAKVNAVAPGGYDAFLDFSTGFWTSDLDPYLAAFTAAGQKIIPVEWAQPDDEKVETMDEKESSKEAATSGGVAPGTMFYSFLVQVPNSMVILEFMSQQRPKHAPFGTPAPIYRCPHPRFVFQAGETPLSVFGDALSQTPSEVGARLQDLTSRGIGVAGDGPSGPGRRFEKNGDSDAKVSDNAKNDNQNLHVAADKPALFAARLSHMTTNAMRDGAFYSQVLGAARLATFTAPSSSSDENNDSHGSSGSDGKLGSGRSSTENSTHAVVLNFRALFSSGYDPSSDPAAMASGISTMPKRPSGTSGGTEAYTQLHLVQRPAHDTALFAPTHHSNGRATAGLGTSPAEASADDLPEVCRGLTVGAYEAAIVACHETTLVSPTCGWNAWMDHHFSLSDPSGKTASELESSFLKWKWPPSKDRAVDHSTAASAKTDAFGGGARYHVFTNKNGGVSFYAIAPNGVSVQITNPPPGTFERPPNLPGAAGNLCTSCEETPSSSSYLGVTTGTSTSRPDRNGRLATKPAPSSTPVSDNDENHKSSGAQEAPTEMTSAAASSPRVKSGSRKDSETDSSRNCPKTCSYNDLGPFTCAEVDTVGGLIDGRCDYKGYDLEVRAGCDCHGCLCSQI